MIPRATRVTTKDGQEHLFLEAWSPDGLAGPARMEQRRVRWTFLNLSTRQAWSTYDDTTFRVVQPQAVP